MKALTLTAAALTILTSFSSVTAASATERAQLKAKKVVMTAHCPCRDGWTHVANGVCIPNTFTTKQPFDH